MASAGALERTVGAHPEEDEQNDAHEPADAAERDGVHQRVAPRAFRAYRRGRDAVEPPAQRERDEHVDGPGNGRCDPAGRQRETRRR